MTSSFTSRIHVTLHRAASGDSLHATLLALTASLIAGCAPTPAAARPAVPPAATLTKSDIVIVGDALVQDGPLISGALVPSGHATVASAIGGPVLSTMAEEGTTVRVGTPLARLDDHTQRAAVSSAHAALRSAIDGANSAARRLARAQRLLSAGAISAEEADEARDQASAADADVAAARSRLADATLELDHTIVRATIAGVVSRRSVSTGDVVQPGRVMFELIDPSSMRLEGAIPSVAVASLRRGAAVQFRVTGYLDRTFAGRVERVSPAADRVTRLVPIVVTIDNRAQHLVAGLYAEGRIVAEERRVLVVPESAVDGASGRPTVLLVSADSVRDVPVQTGARSPDRGTIEILDGLARGDTLLIDHKRGIASGSAVRFGTPVPSTTSTR